MVCLNDLIALQYQVQLFHSNIFLSKTIFRYLEGNQRVIWWTVRQKSAILLDVLKQMTLIVHQFLVVCYKQILWGHNKICGEVFYIKYCFAVLYELIWFNKHKYVCVCLCVSFNTTLVALTCYDILLSVKRFPSKLCVYVLNWPTILCWHFHFPPTFPLC